MTHQFQVINHQINLESVILLKISKYQNQYKIRCQKMKQISFDPTAEFIDPSENSNQLLK
eukprot:CAMPEP_0201230538 /NCGR_PEP_ID=MMETSP0852-20130820/1945_1 /ASSEMBLY_ACC=CAM_ASM_000632 /TAXON_ID=183588 /ORGANISM="Pseudo-nitzschia fraudulenta, Strain WWA7" /LENGTH=59 /DNA_ID=CAMNT_0047521419 /DNA_START=133 /DNA_END=312 /DNA_ORIENTATION=-